MYTLQFDGLFKPVQGANPVDQAGFMCYGWLIWKDHKVIARGHGGVARGQAATSNTAEYMALIEGLDALQDMGVCEQPVTVIGDARSVIDQMQRMTGDLINTTQQPSLQELSDRVVRKELFEHSWTRTERGAVSSGARIV